MTIMPPDSMTILAARHLDAEGPVQVDTIVDTATRSAITTVVWYITKAHNSIAAPGTPPSGPAGASSANTGHVERLEIVNRALKTASIEAIERAEQAEAERDRYARLADDRADHITRLTADRDGLRTRLAEQEAETMRQHEHAQRAEAAIARVRDALASFDGRGVLAAGHTGLDIPTAGEVLDKVRAALDEVPAATDRRRDDDLRALHATLSRIRNIDRVPPHVDPDSTPGRFYINGWEAALDRVRTELVDLPGGAGCSPGAAETEPDNPAVPGRLPGHLLTSPEWQPGDGHDRCPELWGTPPIRCLFRAGHPPHGHAFDESKPSQEAAPRPAPDAEPDTVTDPAWLCQQYAKAIAADDGHPWDTLSADRQESYLDNADAVMRVRDRHLDQLRQRLTLADQVHQDDLAETERLRARLGKALACVKLLKIYAGGLDHGSPDDIGPLVASRIRRILTGLDDRPATEPRPA